MNPTVIAVIVGVCLLGVAGLEGKMLLNAHEEIGNQRVKVAERDGIIKQKEHDADLSSRLDALQQLVETKLKTIGVKTNQGIDNATSDDLAARAAADGVQQLRTTRGRGPQTP